MGGSKIPIYESVMGRRSRTSLLGRRTGTRLPW
jgi:hypothetical protein